MISGFEIECVEPSPWELVLTWSNGRTTAWPAQTRLHALQQQDKIALRPTLMGRLEVRSSNFSEVLWDSSWPRETYADLLSMPADLSPAFMGAMTTAIDHAHRFEEVGTDA
jgi:hypothetical protein